MVDFKWYFDYRHVELKLDSIANWKFKGSHLPVFLLRTFIPVRLNQNLYQVKYFNNEQQIIIFFPESLSKTSICQCSVVPDLYIRLL